MQGQIVLDVAAANSNLFLQPTPYPFFRILQQQTGKGKIGKGKMVNPENLGDIVGNIEISPSKKPENEKLCCCQHREAASFVPPSWVTKQKVRSQAMTLIHKYLLPSSHQS